ncbi:hypothetical protein KIN20_027708 [Parelaphostrongylus tenuis]|uniref:Uncharacterized protein n=1 Tax=Parelaphostrongylus tenuis TaxID=148309 RepID=A0AAD5QZQ2_PARTN|nr:hypothetical protein KIN20_027708 [Parelaphostrongylus tenuis]
MENEARRSKQRGGEKTPSESTNRENNGQKEREAKKERPNEEARHREGKKYRYDEENYVRKAQERVGGRTMKRRKEREEEVALGRRNEGRSAKRKM